MGRNKDSLEPIVCAPDMPWALVQHEDVEHGLAVAACIRPALVQRVMRELRHRFGRVTVDVLQSWDGWVEVHARKRAAAVDRDSSVDRLDMTWEQLYRWLVHHAVHDGAGGLRPHRPVSSVLATISPSHVALFKQLDTDSPGASHRRDLIAPERDVGLGSHLISVYTILKEWHAPDGWCTAGLFHSVYETARGYCACDIRADRARLRAVLGDAVEQLVYLFQPANQCSAVTSDRSGLWDAPLGSSFMLPGVLEGQPARIECPHALRAALITLYWANDVDQEEADDVEYARYVLGKSSRVLPLLTGGARAWLDGLRARVTRVERREDRWSRGGRSYRSW